MIDEDDIHEPEHDHLLDNDDDLDEFFDDEDADPLDQPEGECEFCGDLTDRSDRRGNFVCEDCADPD
ncbi:hypothetical protein [Pseudomonas schmalbachii]|uniref:Small CPxCG-related zinc finger protein n=1 Tax=Pseudomonas schmalbachii TaxID=2816993 RepID=A0ABS3TLU7_9PSED|nr:hypothetical protein [Pseudomonas schmalbachii]MBO3274093.1 hypothetical protein [Pseudomonas schmalbachii]